jgi:hypothetical protein
MTGHPDENPSEINRGIVLTGEELATLCRAEALDSYMPPLNGYQKLFRPISKAVDEIIDSEISVDPIAHAIYELENGGYVEGLARLAEHLLKHRDDWGNWS